MASKLVGASVWEEDLYDHLTSHVEKERDLLVTYQQAASYSGSAAFRYLASLIVEDEIRHHRMFEDLAESLRADTELRAEIPRIPRLDHWGDDRERVVGLTEELITEEENDASELRRLAKELRDVKDTTMWHLVVKLMEMDTAKHLEILNFVRKHAEHAY
jgi:rubrerythrin